MNYRDYIFVVDTRTRNNGHVHPLGPFNSESDAQRVADTMNDLHNRILHQEDYVRQPFIVARPGDPAIPVVDDGSVTIVDPNGVDPSDVAELSVMVKATCDAAIAESDEWHMKFRDALSGFRARVDKAEATFTAKIAALNND